jgi:hypothetical protein
MHGGHLSVGDTGFAEQTGRRVADEQFPPPFELLPSRRRAIAGGEGDGQIQDVVPAMQQRLHVSRSALLGRDDGLLDGLVREVSRVLRRMQRQLSICHRDRLAHQRHTGLP